MGEYTKDLFKKANPAGLFRHRATLTRALNPHSEAQTLTNTLTNTLINTQ